MLHRTWRRFDSVSILADPSACCSLQILRVLEASLSSMLEVQTGKALLGHDQMGNDLWLCEHDGSTNALYVGGV